MRERDPAAASMAGYALLARLASTAIRRLQLRSEGTETLFGQRDVDRLRGLRDFLVASYLGASLVDKAGEAQLSPSLREPGTELKLESHRVVSQLLEREGETTQVFVPRAADALEKLEREQKWDALEPKDQEFVQTSLQGLLQLLAHAPDLVAAPTGEQRLHSTLT